MMSLRICRKKMLMRSSMVSRAAFSSIPIDMNARTSNVKKQTPAIDASTFSEDIGVSENFSPIEIKVKLTKLPFYQAHQHFRASNIPHPLQAKGNYKEIDMGGGDHLGLQQNHIWNVGEINEVVNVSLVLSAASSECVCNIYIFQY